MAKAVGISTKVKDAMNMIEYDGASPVLKYHGTIYLLETAGRELGSLYYTAFDKQGIAQYSVSIPYSFGHTIGYLIDKGDNLRAHFPPRINDLPAEGIAALYT